MPLMKIFFTWLIPYEIHRKLLLPDDNSYALLVLQFCTIWAYNNLTTNDISFQRKFFNFISRLSKIRLILAYLRIQPFLLRALFGGNYTKLFFLVRRHFAKSNFLRVLSISYWIYNYFINIFNFSSINLLVLWILFTFDNNTQ